MIKYSIKHHVKGRIRIDIPQIKGISISRLRNLSNLEIPDGITDVRPNPLSGSVVITYDPSKIDIEKYLETISNDEDVIKILSGATKGN
ncbi:MAG: heavy-metal-associated domain-containing protein [Thermodesulfovibrionales bacterium]|nr:heavy-metal-associated domain-containing protein [Thermodesulfovibrionales bacterium]